MTIDSDPPDSPGAVPDSPVTTAAPSSLRKIFIGADGIRAGWRFVIFVALFVIFVLVIVQGVMRSIPWLHEIARQAQKEGIVTPQFELIFEPVLLGLALLTAGIMSRIEKRRFAGYGIPLKGAFGKLFWQGTLWGLGFETAETLVMYALGGFSFGSLALAGISLVKFAVLWAIGMTFVGLYEEFLFRGYVQFTLASGMGFWPAAILLSAAFGGAHLFNPGEGWVGALSVFTFGMFACFTLRRTGNLWFAIGLHAAGDYAETFLFSVPDSGLRATGHLLNASVHGPRWLTGGAIGPEGSAIAFALFAIMFAIFHWAYPAKTNQATPHPAGQGQ